MGTALGAPVVVRPVFASNQGWQLVAHSDDSLTAQGSFIKDASEALQRQGSRLFGQTSGLAWLPTSYTLTGPDGTRYALDAQGKVTALQSADGVQWLVTDAGISAVSNNAADRVDFVRDAQGRISRVTGEGVGSPTAR